MPRREVLLIAEMIDAGEQAQILVSGRDADSIEADRQLRRPIEGRAGRNRELTQPPPSWPTATPPRRVNDLRRQIANLASP